MMSSTILSRRYAPAASVQSSYPHAFGLPAIVAGWTVAHFLPELRSRLADPRREEAPRETALVHARHVANPLQGAAPHVVVQIPNADALLQLHQGDAVKLHPVHRHAAHLANALVMPVAQRCEHAHDEKKQMRTRFIRDAFSNYEFEAFCCFF